MIVADQRVDAPVGFVAADDARSAIGWIVGDEDVDDPAAVSLAEVAEETSPITLGRYLTERRNTRRNDKGPGR
jgi:hypothetical protein